MILTISSSLLFAAFISYLLATLLFGGAVHGKKDETESHKRFAKYAVWVTLAGFTLNVGYFVCRWIAVGHAPVSNMFEFTTAFGMFIVGAFLILYKAYRMPALGLVALPIAVIVIAYASVFPKDVAPLIPALKSNWLTIHVITTVIGEAILAISAFSGLVYLLKRTNVFQRTRERFALETILFTLVVFIGFILATLTFQATNYQADFQYVDQKGERMPITYTMPALVGMNDSTALTENHLAPFVEAPAWVNGKKVTSVIWSLLYGIVLYGILRILFRKRLVALLQPLVRKADLSMLDEMNYRAVLIGFPVFTLGALIFAMIWAQEAWSRMWGWDPKEVWALITWLYYAAFLHLRLSKGWEGKKSAWLAVIGFAIIMFNLIAVNLILAGLHSYAG
ncbi:c-type cytochrome biogenesis protein CcsB [Kurthia senegalensis]|uniref:c-type cytochrome biogenesis protein CcsB n=1 Tax=Kurthia senegalensis TaxID=1033740 RepID=UPI00028A310D|nr:c-type cytochrome biogenesis protein CcsB [Kurthia senegalensis]